MKPTLGKPPLVLRQIRSADAKAIYESCSDWDIAKWIPPMPVPYSLDDAKKYIRLCKAEWKNGVSFTYIIESNKILAGSITLKPTEDQKAELGYWIAKSFWGKGFATAACKLVIAEGFDSLDLHRIFARHLAGNEASGRVLEKCGLKKEGVLRGNVFSHGEFFDEVVYGMVRDDLK